MPHVDEVQLCWQGISNKGEKRACVEVFCRGLTGEKVTMLEFSPDLTAKTKHNEAAKLQMRIDYAKKHGFTHFIGMACDHFYDPEQIEAAKLAVVNNGYDITFTRMFTYYKQINWRVDPIEDYMCPFITKISPGTTVGRSGGNYPVRVDPSTQIFPWSNPYIFGELEVMLHHYSMVRVDIEEKFRNAAASIRWKPEQIERFIKEFENAKLGDEISYFHGRRLVLAQT
jgi:hypothetical protein